MVRATKQGQELCEIKEPVGKLRDTEMIYSEQPIPLPPLHEAVSRYDAPLVHSLLERGAIPMIRTARVELR